ncbi:PepSY-associated TM helix domain-containing protein [Altericroceibacterium endophyticum]|uniref:PepSY domain-containing protein n=1 Tax=Altericroceibacterium endophyticum TaxID=1808508 RepID=A0A6I4T7R7_9SPHN|nr:PepSY-associated TM helix domain-containing protein [Altericroceibacterium endophyticum]MXO65900.1 PepSY domain-containing protein [Altericroceibacterium endophyticum]
MKMPADVVKMYKEIHGWVGIISGLALFIAFYAGAITMFEGPVQQWASAPSQLAPAPSLQRTPELLTKVMDAHPEAAASYEVNLVIDAHHPARLVWKSGDPEEIEHGGGTTHYASLRPDGSLQVETSGPSPVAQFIDDLHRNIGLPFDHEITMPIMGAVSMLYVIALVSGLIVLLPSLVKDLFALRFGKNVKRMWLDLHNLLGVFSLPFHIVMALTALVFAFHDQLYMAQGVAFDSGGQRPRMVAAGPSPEPLAPAEMVAKLREEAPYFEPYTLSYAAMPGGRSVVRATGGDPDYPIRTPLYGVVTADPVNGKILSVDYMPGRQDGWSEAVTSFFALHYGSFGGGPIRWAYFLLGLSGAFIFYTGNLLWVESRRKRERKAGAVEQTRATRILAALTVGVPLGCIAGIALTLSAAKPLGHAATTELHSAIYYAVFLMFTAWALVRGAARSGPELSCAAAFALLTIPAASLLATSDWPGSLSLWLVDGTAVALAVLLVRSAGGAKRRARSGPRDSVWAAKGASAIGESV